MELKIDKACIWPDVLVGDEFSIAPEDHTYQELSYVVVRVDDQFVYAKEIKLEIVREQ